MGIPDVMRAVCIREPGGVEVLVVDDQYTVPGPAAGEVLIKVSAAGINRADVLQRMGTYPMPPGVATDVPGLEVSGTVVAVGSEAGRWTLGTQVCALVSSHGYAEYTIAPAAQCMAVPAGVTLIEAAGLPETYCTVWANLFERGALKGGETVLIQGVPVGLALPPSSWRKPLVRKSWRPRAQPGSAARASSSAQAWP
jgi:NADPH2:quinone reductase